MSGAGGARLPRPAPSFERVHVAQTGSTNGDALSAALGDGGDFGWWTALRQTAGRGRAGRRWTSEDGSFAGSLLVRRALSREVVEALPLIAGIATWDAIVELAGAPQIAEQCRLKWPNDVLIGGAKVAGLLIERVAPVAGRREAVVIGIGMNLDRVPQVPGRATTSLAAAGIAADFEEVLAALSRTLPGWIAIAQASSPRSEGPSALVRAAWLARALANGTEVVVNSGDRQLSGRIAGLSGRGALRLALHDGDICEVTFGDVLLKT